MVKININTPLPHESRNTFIQAFKSIGWKYERVIQNGEFAILRFFGKFPSDGCKPNIDIILGDDVNINEFKQLFVGEVEIYFLFERS